MIIQYIDTGDSCTRRDFSLLNLGSRKEKPAGGVRRRPV